VAVSKHRRRPYTKYEKKRLEPYAPPLRALITPEEGEIFDRLKTRKGTKRGPYTSALLRVALPLEDLGGDAVAVLAQALEQLKAIKAGKSQLDMGEQK
jgi:hypothetical protein